MKFFIHVPWSDVSVLGFSVLLRALTHAVTDAMTQRMPSIATPTAMPTGPNLIFSTKYTKGCLSRINIHCILFATQLVIFVPLFRSVTTDKVLSRGFLPYSFLSVFSSVLIALSYMHSWSLNALPLKSKIWPFGQLNNS